MVAFYWIWGAGRTTLGDGCLLLDMGCGTDHLPEIGPAGLPFLDRPPQSTKGGKKERQTSANQKRNAYFSFKLLIINDINQYFNIHLHLISFIIYNR